MDQWNLTTEFLYTIQVITSNNCWVIIASADMQPQYLEREAANKNKNVIVINALEITPFSHIHSGWFWGLFHNYADFDLIRHYAEIPGNLPKHV